MKRSAVLGLTLLLLTPAFAWDDTGHMVVAKIAYDHLRPEVRAKVDDLLLQNPAPDFTDFISSATYPDQLKRYGIKAYSPWHAISMPFSRDGIAGQIPRPDNVVWAIGECRKALTDAKTIPYERARMLRFLIHLVGDIHQPLHAATIYDAAHPTGDDNGRDFSLGEGKANRMHALWDTAFGLFHDLDDSRNADLAEVASVADTVVKSIGSESAGDESVLDPAAWASESYELATTFAYTAKEGVAPDATYVQRARQICQRRIVLAGLRLAATLNKALGK